jgi:hypothetical protein
MSKKKEKHDIPIEHVMEIYSGLLDEIWQRVAYFIGGITLQVLMSTAIRRTSLAFPFMTHVTVTVNGVSLKKLGDVCRDLPERESIKALQNLITEFFSLLVCMSGDIIIRELTPMVKSAEGKLVHTNGGNGI